MPYELGKLKLLARGGQADIYEIDGSRILRVIRHAGPGEDAMLRNECRVMTALRGRGVGVPEVFDMVEADGLPALVMERVTGLSMLEQMMRATLDAGRFASELARLHCQVADGPAVEGLEDIKVQIARFMESTDLLDEADRAFVRSLLAGLPDGDAVLHGDFHPGNILAGSAGYIIIDWPRAAKGAFLADVAHTWLLLADKPRLPGEGAAKFRLMRAMARLFAGMYLKAVRRRESFDWEEFGRWVAVQAAGRAAIGQPGERATRAAFVKTCRRCMEKGVGPAAWLKKL